MTKTQVSQTGANQEYFFPPAGEEAVDRCEVSVICDLGEARDPGNQGPYPTFDSRCDCSATICRKISSSPIVMDQFG